VAILTFLYGYFLIIAFRYGRGLTEKAYLFWIGIFLGLILMGLSPFLHAGTEFAWLSTLAILIGLSLYQAYYLMQYRFFPAKVGLIINSVITFLIFLSGYIK
jgi:hypothetical protein